MNPPDDTIAAIATPIGVGAISVIRLSGARAIAVADRNFSGRQPLAQAPSHTAHFGKIVGEDGSLIDEVVATVFRAPHSYTAEDVVEVSCHGGTFVTQRILGIFLRSGARLAEPGEFTRRAFLNGRIDLSQAEAVADLIRARSEVSHRASMMQLSGKLSQHIGNIRDKLIGICSLLELELDFVEEGLEFADRERVASEIQSTIGILDKLISSYAVGKIYREGVAVVIAGKPNVGKSSILNSLLNESRAIVTPQPGTTRDTIEENLVVDGVLFKLVDTAGLRESEDVVEIEGIRRTRVEIEASDVVLYVVDALRGFEEIDLKMLRELESSRTRCLVVVNKVDLGGKKIAFRDFSILNVCALNGEGFDELRTKLVGKALDGQSLTPDGSLIVTNLRHRESLVRARESLLSALKGLREGVSNEFLAVDIRESMNGLGEIIGIVTSDDVLNGIFAKFCIGK